MYKIFTVYEGRKYYDRNEYTEREARREVRAANKDFRRDPSRFLPYFIESV